MRIIICVKQVPDVVDVKIDTYSNKLIREGVLSIINPFDEFVVEEAVRIKEKHKGEVIAISMGPTKALDVLKICLAMGADKGYLLSDAALAGSDTLTTSFALSCFIKQLHYDLVICGLESIDSSTGHVGPEIAEKLGIPQITFVCKIDINPNVRKGIFTRETDTGYQIIEAKLPILITLVKGINVPREPDTTLIKENNIGKIGLKDIGIDSKMVGIDGSPTYVKKICKAKPLFRENMMINYKIPAHDRVKQIMRGGMLEKSKNSKIEGKTEEIVNKACDFILHNILKE